MLILNNPVIGQSKKERKKLETVKQKKKENSGEIRSASESFIKNKRGAKAKPSQEDREKRINSKLVKKNQPSSGPGTDFQGKQKSRKRDEGSNNKATNFEGNTPVSKISGERSVKTATTFSGNQPIDKNTPDNNATTFGGNQKTNKRNPDTKATTFGGNQRTNKRNPDTQATTFGGNQRTNKGNPDTKATTFGGSQRSSSNNPDLKATTFGGNYRLSKGNNKSITRITNFAGSQTLPKKYNASYMTKSTLYRGDDLGVYRKKNYMYVDKAKYSGDIKVKKNKPNLVATTYRGNIKKQSSGISPGTLFAGNLKYKSTSGKSQGTDFAGNLKIRSSRSQAAYYRKLSAKANKFEGDYKFRKATKDMHPSAVYQGSKNVSKIEQKEKARKRSLWWFRNNYDADQPKSVKQKEKKPRYDKKESTIWY
ncbi:hypothetical protein BH23BAC1_BH23BAC1_34670 [soil metagenome]